MPNFILNRNSQPTGEHEVHQLGVNCQHLPAQSNQISLGTHSDCHGAIRTAKQANPGVAIDGCFYCCRPCHTR